MRNQVTTRLLLSVVTIHLEFVMYSKLFYKCTVHIRQGQIFHWKKCVQFTTVDVTLYSYHKCMPKTEAIN